MINDIQYHRGADEGFRRSTSQLRRDCEHETRVRYRWTMDNGPVSYSPSKKNWELHSSLKRKFLSVNYRFDSDGRKIRII
jgi:hypothetical protein